jgi:hypothetical protein
LVTAAGRIAAVDRTGAQGIRWNLGMMWGILKGMETTEAPISLLIFSDFV